LPGDRIERVIRRALRAFLGQLHQGAGGDGLAQRRIIFPETRGEIDDAGIGHGAVFGGAVNGEGGETGRGHFLFHQSAIVTSATKAGSRTAWPVNGVPSSNQERGAGAPHSVCRRGSFSDQRSGSWS